MSTPTPLHKAVTFASQFKRDGVTRETAEWFVANKLIDVDPGVAECFPVATKHIWDGVPLPEDTAPKPQEIEQANADPMPLLPSELKKLTRWVRWKLQVKDGRPTKVPYQMNGDGASTTNASTWTTYQNAVKDMVINAEQGVGFVLNDDGITGIDLDGCRNPETGDLTEWAESIINACNSYTEITPSGTGVRVLLRGVIPGKDKVFNLNPAAGYGDKVKIEIYSTARYFTTTGNSYFEDEEAGGVEAVDLIPIYQLLQDTRAKYPAPKNPKSEAADAGESTPITYEPGTTLKTDKYTIFKRGHIVEGVPNFQITDGVGTLTYPSHSEADLGFATVLAFHHDCDEKKMEDDFRESPMWREKWERTKQYDFKKALETASRIKERQESKQMDLTAATATPVMAPNHTAPTVEVPASMILEEDGVIPPFDDSVITGIFREIVDLAAGGTTIPRQFSFLVAKVYIGTRMAGGGMTFEGIEDDPTVYGATIGASGTSKGLSWKRTMRVLLPESLLKRKVFVLHSFDSGAGIRDAFFDYEMPIIGCIEEIRSLGHKAGEKKNPEIIDTIVELANSHVVSRVKAKRSKRDKAQIYEKAYLSLYMCGQNGDSYMSSFPGRKEMGLWDRFYPEYSDPIVPGDLPAVDSNKVLQLLAQLEKFPFSGHMTMGEGVKDALNAFWSEQPKDVNVKVRFKSHLMLDMYFSAWSQGRMVATVEDLNVAIRIFHRQMVIRRIHFHEEVPDRIGHFIGLLKMIAENMRKRLNQGASMESVAMTIRDFQTDTNAYRDNEIATFNIAWRNFHADHLATYEVTAKNGHKYTKYLPMPYEDEMWCAKPQAAGTTA